jgi:hypothetical protein
MAEKPQRVHLSRKKGWRMPPGTKKVERSSPWGNKVSKPESIEVVGEEEAHRVAIEEYRRWAFAPEQADFRANVRRELRGQNLACWCRMYLACHADVLLEIANGEE